MYAPFIIFAPYLVYAGFYLNVPEAVMVKRLMLITMEIYCSIIVAVSWIHKKSEKK
jgi:hypothetical protein